MTPKSLAYMVVAVFVGYMLVSAIPGQVAMYATPSLSGEAGEAVTVTGSGFSIENDTKSSEIEDLSESLEDAVESSEAVAEIASSASQATADAVEAANAARDARSSRRLMETMVWWIVDVFIALVVYWFARQRFA